MRTQQLSLDTKISNKNKNNNIKVVFPFKNKFASIEKLDEEGIISGICPLCGLMMDLVYTKVNSGYIQKICAQCAIKYVSWWSNRK